LCWRQQILEVVLLQLACIFANGKLIEGVITTPPALPTEVNRSKWCETLAIPGIATIGISDFEIPNHLATPSGLRRAQVGRMQVSDDPNANPTRK
jgi:hypothetical protein